MNQETKTDREQYDYHTAKMILASQKGHAGDLNYHWAQIEIIKNRHGGMPPPPLTQPNKPGDCETTTKSLLINRSGQDSAGQI